MNNKYVGLIIIVIALFLMYFATTIFYNTGLAITDLNVKQSESDGNQYDISYMLRSVRGFYKVVSEYTILSEDNQIIATGSNELSEIKDGSFQIDDTLNGKDNSLEAKKIEIIIYEFDENNNKKQILNQTFDI